jgi:hypothetical protein
MNIYDKKKDYFKRRTEKWKQKNDRAGHPLIFHRPLITILLAFLVCSPLANPQFRNFLPFASLLIADPPTSTNFWKHFRLTSAHSAANNWTSVFYFPFAK